MPFSALTVQRVSSSVASAMPRASAAACVFAAFAGCVLRSTSRPLLAPAVSPAAACAIWSCTNFATCACMQGATCRAHVHKQTWCHAVGEAQNTLRPGLLRLCSHVVAAAEAAARITRVHTSGSQVLPPPAIACVPEMETAASADCCMRTLIRLRYCDTLGPSLLASSTSIDASVAFSRSAVDRTSLTALATTASLIVVMLARRAARASGLRSGCRCEADSCANSNPAASCYKAHLRTATGTLCSQDVVCVSAGSLLRHCQRPA